MFLVAAAVSLVAYNEKWGRVVVLFAFFMWILNFKKSSFAIAIRHPINVAATIYLVFQLLSLLWSKDINSGVDFIYRYAVYFYIPLLMVSSAITIERLSPIITVFVVSVLLSILAIFPYIPDVMSGSLPRGILSQYMNPIPYSVILAFAALLLIGFLCEVKSKVHWALGLVALLSILVVLVLLGQRTGQFVFVLALSFVAIRYVVEKKGIGHFTAIPAIIACAGILAYTLYSLYSPFQHRIDLIASESISALETDHYKSSVGVRIASYVIARDIAREENVLIGVGVGDVPETIRSNILKYHKDEMTESYHMHSYYLDVFVGMGVVGLLCILYLLKNIYQTKLANADMQYVKISLFLVMFLSNIPDRAFHQQNTMMMFSIFLGLIVVSAEKQGSIS
jgi:hypothetical protein